MPRTSPPVFVFSHGNAFCCEQVDPHAKNGSAPNVLEGMGRPDGEAANTSAGRKAIKPWMVVRHGKSQQSDEVLHRASCAESCCWLEALLGCIFRRDEVAVKDKGGKRRHAAPSKPRRRGWFLTPRIRCPADASTPSPLTCARFTCARATFSKEHNRNNQVAGLPDV